MLSLSNITDQVKTYHTGADVDLIQKAYAYAEQQHEGQMRKSGDPYFIHPVSVAHTIAELKLDDASICAALLHDVVEDTEASLDDISDRFGEDIAFLVDGVTKLGRLEFGCKEDQQAESLRKMLVAMAQDIRVLLVKLCDRLDNMRTLEHMKDDKRERIAQETLDIYAPLAGRLGIHWLKAELEDLSFAYINPKAHQELEKAIRRVSKADERYTGDVVKRLQMMLVERGFAVEVTGRIKHLYSIYKKMQAQDIEFDQVYDYVAFRVITENVADCYAALGVIHSQWTPIPGRFKDYVALPKPNMYQSLHTTVMGPGRRRIEVQIRTQDMHRTAELGIAAHWQYKQRGGGIDKRDAERFAWLRQLMEHQHDVEDPAEFFESVKVDLFPDEVYVFTPKGAVKTFPRGATPVDFAFSVHSEVGMHCQGARVNGVMVPLRHSLKNGDVVEIITSNTQTPNKDWLSFVKTARAKSKIRTYVRREERRRSVEIGKEILERELQKRSLSASRFMKSKKFQELLKTHKLNSTEELYAKIGYGKLAVPNALGKLFEDEQGKKDEDSLRPNILERTVDRVRRRSRAEDGIVIDGMHDMMVRYGKCCNPLPGDPVTGWITRGRGVTVHRRGCSRSLELDPERRIDVSWASDTQVNLPVSMRVVTDDKPGILANISATFRESGVNISEANCRTSNGGRAINVFQFTVSDVGKLKVLMRNVQRIDGVFNVERV